MKKVSDMDFVVSLPIWKTTILKYINVDILQLITDINMIYTVNVLKTFLHFMLSYEK